MPSKPDDVVSIDLSGAIDHVLAVTFTATFAFGFGSTVVATLLGGLSAAIGDRLSLTWSLVAGSIGTALFGAALPWLILGPKRIWWASIGLLCFGATLAFLVAKDLPHDQEWRLLRWGITATPLGVVVCALSDPIRWMKSMGPEEDGPWIVVRFTEWATRAVKLIAVGRQGMTLAGGIGGMTGGLIVGALVAEAGDELLTKQFGHTWPLSVVNGLLGALAGAANGWLTWSRAIRFGEESAQEIAEST